MTSTGASFLPRLESVFYAVFDVEQGPKIVSQVPEALIATTNPSGHVSSGSSTSLLALSPISVGSSGSLADFDFPSRTSSSSLLSSPISQRLDPRTSIISPHKRGPSANRALFHFDDISKYVIPPKALCGRLVICTTKSHRILGFPVRLDDEAYPRNYFLYNVCFVFERTADLSCYEPVARKTSRVLTSCEQESKFLSSLGSGPAIHAILEQLYEDLNSYSETSIPIDRFNSIELKIFSFYPNPSPVKDWTVPLALIDLPNRIEPNWDLTVAKVCPFIDGINHVSRIARLANCDLNLTRLAISHLLYYQVIMMIDIFQYSNMYALRKSMQWLADEEHIKGECGPYVTKPKHVIPDWPTLLHLYSRFRAGKTVREWMEEHGVHKLNIDVRRFTSFGVIKGFLRRVHRWPILLHRSADAEPTPKQPSAPSTAQDKRASMATLGRRRGLSESATAAPTTEYSPLAPRAMDTESLRVRSRVQDAQPTMASAGAELVASSTSATFASASAAVGRGGRQVAAGATLARRTSAAESSLALLRSRDARGKPSQDRAYQTMSKLYTHTETRRKQTMDIAPVGPARSQATHVFSASPDKRDLAADTVDSEQSSGGRSTGGGFGRRVARDTPEMQGQAQFPSDLLELLDGEHHTDEICTRFEVGWPVLRQWLFAAGGAQEGDEGDEEYGQISIIYR
ncbi:NPR2-domain-containing protein [Epithele typhae]|uniref:NPR2-domain-containing protein n=1 Tax=Epithele typhae TaxID=378194 RepID=UPI002008851E|nr:NPR2-domain-containing protein [Epithele typhae]KAH9945929.1 NPR2-domain-containing protein [Epithele typhae]